MACETTTGVFHGEFFPSLAELEAFKRRGDALAARAVGSFARFSTGCGIGAVTLEKRRPTLEKHAGGQVGDLFSDMVETNGSDLFAVSDLHACRAWRSL